MNRKQLIHEREYYRPNKRESTFLYAIRPLQPPDPDHRPVAPMCRPCIAHAVSRPSFQAVIRVVFLAVAPAHALRLAVAGHAHEWQRAAPAWRLVPLFRWPFARQRRPLHHVKPPASRFDRRLRARAVRLAYDSLTWLAPFCELGSMGRGRPESGLRVPRPALLLVVTGNVAAACRVIVVRVESATGQRRAPGRSVSRMDAAGWPNRPEPAPIVADRR